MSFKGLIIVEGVEDGEPMVHGGGDRPRSLEPAVSHDQRHRAPRQSDRVHQKTGGGAASVEKNKLSSISSCSQKSQLFSFSFYVGPISLLTMTTDASLMAAKFVPDPTLQ